MSVAVDDMIIIIMIRIIKAPFLRRVHSTLQHVQDQQYAIDKHYSRMKPAH